MKSAVSLLRGGLFLLMSLTLGGCLPPAGQSEEEKEPHFLAGKSHINQMDYRGAIECFEKALEVNPQSAAAHFELGCLYEQKEAEPAAAIYHYERYLKLRPQAENAEIVKQQIMACKQELARSVSLGPITEKQQRDLEKLLEEKRQLTEENQRLREELEKWQTHAGHMPGPANPPSPTPVVVARMVAPSSSAAQVSTSASNSPPGPNRVSVPAGPVRTHTVKAGETPTLIARKYGIRVEVLMAANPRLDARRMQVGQLLSIPPP